MKTVLVTGSSGLIGTRFFEKYADKFNLIPGDLCNGIDILNFDDALKTISNLIGRRGLDAVVHMAAFTDVSSAYEQSDDEKGICYQLNVVGANNVIKISEEFGSHLIHLSTDFVFNGMTKTPFKEESAPAPIEWYGETKRLAEEAVVNSNGFWTVARIAFPYLKDQGARPDLVTRIIGKLKAGEKLYLFGDQLITPTFGDDIVDAISRFIESSPEREVFHVVGPEAMSPYDLGHRLAKLLKAPTENLVETSLVKYLEKDPRPRQRYLAMDSNKYRMFCRDHNYTVPLTIEKSLEGI
tara:strand:- start:802 stop:1689 length:888 start_codon:yes stop_codon:yes gene_type:complete